MYWTLRAPERRPGRHEALCRRRLLPGRAVACPVLVPQRRLCLQVEKHSPISPAQCLSYVLSQPVSTIVPGVKSVAEIEAALRYYAATDVAKGFALLSMNIFMSKLKRSIETSILGNDQSSAWRHPQIRVRRDTSRSVSRTISKSQVSQYIP